MMEFGWLWPAIARDDANEDIVRRRFGVVRRDLPISVAVEHASVEELEFRLIPCAARVFLPQPLVGKLGLRIVIAPSEPGSGRRRVEGTTSIPWRPRRDCLPAR